MHFTPTTEQRRLIEFVPNGHVLIRGEAGSGKTTVLAARVVHLVSGQLQPPRALLLTYNRALATYVRGQLEGTNCSKHVQVFTIDGWVRHFYNCCRNRQPLFVSDTRRNKLLLDIKTRIVSKRQNSSWARAPNEFWIDEIDWMFGQGIRSLDGYREMPRQGRGTKVRVNDTDRALAWEVFAAYRAELKQMGLFDSQDLLGVARSALLRGEDGKKRIPEDLLFDHVLIDEVQDFNLSWLLFIVPLARQSMTLAGDLGQKIYRRSFSWKDAGINVVGRSFSLKGSFRTTKEIMEVAVHLAKNEDVRGDDYLAPTIPSRSGPRVKCVRRPTWLEAEAAAIDHIVLLWQSRTSETETVVVGSQFARKAEKLREALTEAGLPAVFAKQDDLVLHTGSLLVTTFHQLKGLEFDHIVLAGLEDSTMPQYWIDRQESERPEEAEEYLRRLVYVAMTRARNSVMLIGGEPFCRFFDPVPASLFEMA